MNQSSLMTSGFDVESSLMTRIQWREEITIIIETGSLHVMSLHFTL